MGVCYNADGSGYLEELSAGVLDVEVSTTRESTPRLPILSTGWRLTPPLCLLTPQLPCLPPPLCPLLPCPLPPCHPLPCQPLPCQPLQCHLLPCLPKLNLLQ